jgi:hypothetical protein
LCRYDPRSGNVVFWQEPEPEDENELVFFYHRN